ncbi:MAG: carboxypeptidase regulatory-like domain-containing protein [Deltaproteobacteria bacterium]|nr:carboxypeptidase regulatory-like domain-containing protein [Deltaproteobacteria bacterium]
MNRILLIFLIIGFLAYPNFSPADDGSTALKQKEMNGVRYVSGGVGIEERTALKGAMKEYNLKLVFASIEGSYLSNVRVVIRDPGGKMVIDVTADGPWLLLDLPSGTYEVCTTYHHERKTRTVKVDKGLQTALFHWRL